MKPGQGAKSLPAPVSLIVFYCKCIIAKVKPSVDRVGRHLYMVIRRRLTFRSDSFYNNVEIIQTLNADERNDRFQS